MNRCPKRAIQTAHGVVAAFLVLFCAATPALIDPVLRPLVAHAWPGGGFVARVVRSVFGSVLMLAALFLWYRALHRGLRFRPVERVAVMTSLTHFRFWRRYRPPHSFGGSDRPGGDAKSDAATRLQAN